MMATVVIVCIQMLTPGVSTLLSTAANAFMNSGL